jgi:zinc and cadmium transporter
VTPLGSLALYSVAILAGALVGGAIPLMGGRRHRDEGLSFSAGVMLGAAFFHMLPEAIADAGLAALPWVLGGFLFLFLLERYVLVHVCGEPGVAVDLHLHGDAAHAPHPGTGCEVHTLGLAAFLGLSLHTVVDGFALGAASHEEGLGLLVFLAILAHKVPSSFSLSAILRAEGYSRARALGMNAVFALMVPLGAALYVLLDELVHAEAFTGIALAASAGTFLHLALSDIIPDLHRRGASRLRSSGALLIGVATMWGLRLVHAH